MQKDVVICKQAAIDTVEAMVDKSGKGEIAGFYNVILERVIDKLNDLPSAQLEIIHCRDCKHHWTHSCMDAFPREICDLDQTFYDSNIDYCSLAERRTDELGDS